MRKLILCLALISFCNYSFAQLSLGDTAVQLMPLWAKGDKQNYTYTKHKIKVQNRDTTLNEKAIFDIELSVLEETDSSYTMQWLYKDYKTTSKNPLAAKIGGVVKGLRIVYTTSDIGEVIEIVNQDEIQASVTKMISVLKKEMSKLVTPEEMKTLDTVFATAISSEAMQQSSMEDIAQYHLYYGAQFSLRDTITVKDIVQTQFGAAVESDILLYVTAIDSAANFCEINFEQKFNPDAMKEAVTSYLTDLARKMNAEPPTAADIEDVGQLGKETYNTSRIQLTTGWLNNAKNIEVSSVPNSKTIEILTLQKK
ncbi:MAG: hypothetical protein RL660_1809 [Bacteroidota bacterium]|jgi:hypothetical protein